MKKLRLDDLRVDTFATGSAMDGQGTVRAHAPGYGVSYDMPCEPQPWDYTEVNCPVYTDVSCVASCNGTCYGSCYGSCQNTCASCYQNTCAGYGTCYPCYPVPDQP